MSEKLNRFSFGLMVSVAVGMAAACSSQSPYGEPVTPAAASSAVNATDPEMQPALDLINRVPDSPSGYVQLAVLQIQRARRTGDFGLNKKAETAVDKALELSPNDIPSRKLRGSLMLTFHRFAEALDYGKKLVVDVPNDSFVYGILTDANFELGNYDDAVAAAQKMVDIKPNSPSYARVAHLRSIYGDHAGAVEMYKTAAKTIDPKDSEGQAWCLVQLGDEYFKYGKFAEAEKVYDEALAILPDFYLALGAKGKIRAAQNDLEGAEKFLTAVLDRVPNVESAILLGDIYTKNGEPQKAKTQYDLAEVLESKTGVNNDQKRLALMWADQNIRLPEALEITQREQALRRDIYTEDALAWSLFKNGKFKEAKESAARAMRLKSNDARILYHAGMIEKETGNRRESVRLLGSALKLNPAFDLIQSEIARRILDELKKG